MCIRDRVITDYDLIILAPQMASMYKELEKDCSAKGVKSATTSGAVSYTHLLSEEPPETFKAFPLNLFIIL